MGFFKRWKEKRESKKQQTKEIKHPESSYDIYNQSETLTLQADINNNLLVAYNEEDSKLEITNTNLQNKNKKEANSSSKKDKTRTTEVSNKSKTSSAKKDKTRTTEISKTRTNTTTISKTGGVDMTQKGRNIYYVSARKDKDGKRLGWEVKKENADKITKLCKTKDEAIEYVKEKAGNQGSTCIIRKLDGSIDKTLKFDAK